MGELNSVLLIVGGALCVGVLALVLFSGSVLPQMLSCARVRVPGGRERALRARFATGALRGLGALPLVFAGAVGVGLAMGVGGLGVGARWTGVAVIVGTAAAAAYRSRGGAARHHFLALTPSGCVLRPDRFRAFVPWDAIDDVDVVGKNVDTAVLGFVLADPDAVVAWPLDRLAMRMRKPKQVDIAVRLTDMDADPRSVVHAFCYYLDRPGRRQDLGTPAELNHLRAVQRRELA